MQMVGKQLFVPDERAVEIYRVFARSVSALAHVRLIVTRSQVAFWARHPFAYAWNPSRYITSAVPMVVSVATNGPLSSSRIKEVVHPSPRTWMHHIELRSVTDVDEELLRWVVQAYQEAA